MSDDGDLPVWQHDAPQGYEYGSLWPIRKKVDESGNRIGPLEWGYAPTLLVDSYNALVGALNAPKQALQGKIAGDEDMAAKAMNFAMTFVGAGYPIPKPEVSLGIAGGNPIKLKALVDLASGGSGREAFAKGMKEVIREFPPGTSDPENMYRMMSDIGDYAYAVVADQGGPDYEKARALFPSSFLEGTPQRFTEGFQVSSRGHNATVVDWGHSPDFTDNLFDDSALSQYVGAGHLRLNRVLRRGSGISPSDAEMAQSLDALMKPIPEPVQVFRGVENRRGIQYEVGDIIEDKGFHSTTGSAKTALHFGIKNDGGTGSIGVVFQYKLPRGTPAIRTNPGEAELILARGGRFKVVKVEARAKGTIHDDIPSISSPIDIGQVVTLEPVK